MASGNKNKNAEKPEKKQGFMDKVLHGDHGHATEADEMNVSDDEGDPGPDPVSEKVSVGADAPSESKHHHKKFDKFQKGNR